MSALAPNHRQNRSGWVIESNTSSGVALITTEACNSFDVKSHLGASAHGLAYQIVRQVGDRQRLRMSAARHGHRQCRPASPRNSVAGRSGLSVTSVPPLSSASSNCTVDSSTVDGPGEPDSALVRACSTRWCGSGAVRRETAPELAELAGQVDFGVLGQPYAQLLSPGRSVPRTRPSGRAGTTARKRRVRLGHRDLLRVAGDGQAERVAVRAAVAGEQVLQRLAAGRRGTPCAAPGAPGMSPDTPIEGRSGRVRSSAATSAWTPSIRSTR